MKMEYKISFSILKKQIKEFLLFLLFSILSIKKFLFFDIKLTKSEIFDSEQIK